MVREGSVADDEEDSFEIDDGSFDDGAVFSRQSEDGHFGPRLEGEWQIIISHQVCLG